MKNMWLFAIVTSIAMSCGNETKVNDETIDSTPDSVAVNDTIKVSDTISFNAIASTMGGDTITPADRSRIFYAFTVKLAENKHKPLSAKEARKRFLPIDPNCDQDAVHTACVF
jgi:hypothetical protein